MAAKRIKAVFQLHVSLVDIDPPIWRSVQVLEDVKLSRLHRVFQVLFNWEDYHLHDFRVGQRIYSVPDPEDAWNERTVIDERVVPLQRIVERVGDTFEYVYDFGDDWRHKVVLEAILLPAPDAVYPRCVAGARNGPPEDAGGPWGYADYLQALADPRHEDHHEKLAWRGRWDPEAFSVDAVNRSLSKTFKRPAAGPKAALVKKPKRELDRLTTIVQAALLRTPAPAIRKKRIAPGAVVPLALTKRERKLVLEDSLAPDELTSRLREPPGEGKTGAVRLTLGELDELAGYIASEANHTANRIHRRQWDKIFEKIVAILDSYMEED